MKQYDELNQGLKSINNRIRLSDGERAEVITAINQRMDQYQPDKRLRLQWIYYLASATAAILFFIILVIPSVVDKNQNWVQGNNPQESSDKNPVMSGTSEEEITVHIMNYTPFKLERLIVDVYRDGKLITTQGGIYADESIIEPGDIFDFVFLTEELGQGKIEIEVETSQEDQTHTTPRASLVIDHEKEYHFKLVAENNSSFYLEGDLNNFEIVINNDYIEMVREEVKVGSKKSKIERLLGNDYVVKEMNLGGNEEWRYNLGMVENYKAPDDIFLKEDLVDMRNGKIQAVLWFSWDKNNKLLSYSSLYLDSEDGKLYSYYVFPDGREKLERVY